LEIQVGAEDCGNETAWTPPVRFKAESGGKRKTRHIALMLLPGSYMGVHPNIIIVGVLTDESQYSGKKFTISIKPVISMLSGGKEKHFFSARG